MIDVKGKTSTLSSSRLALFAGFGGLLAIIALSGFDALRVLRQFQRQDEQIPRQFLFRNRVLNNIRSEVYLSGAYVRDYLFDPNPDRSTAFGAIRGKEQNHRTTELTPY